MRQCGDLAAPADGSVQRPLQSAAGEQERTVGREREDACDVEEEQNQKAQVGRGDQGVADRGATDDRRYRKERQRKPGGDLHQRRGR